MGLCSLPPPPPSSTPTCPPTPPRPVHALIRSVFSPPPRSSPTTSSPPPPPPPLSYTFPHATPVDHPRPPSRSLARGTLVARLFRALLSGELRGTPPSRKIPLGLAVSPPPPSRRARARARAHPRLNSPPPPREPSYGRTYVREAAPLYVSDVAVGRGAPRVSWRRSRPGGIDSRSLNPLVISRGLAGRRGEGGGDTRGFGGDRPRHARRAARVKPPGSPRAVPSRRRNFGESAKEFGPPNARK